jgi:NADP-dependent 3-hydroxy acid dehydrogenase YdfG
MNLDTSLGDKAVVVRASGCIGSAIAEKLGAAGAQIFSPAALRAAMDMLKTQIVIPPAKQLDP